MVWSSVEKPNVEDWMEKSEGRKTECGLGPNVEVPWRRIEWM